MFYTKPHNLEKFKLFSDQSENTLDIQRNRTKLIRVINSAIYVEEPLSIMTPHKKSATTLNYTAGEDMNGKQKPLKSKRCCCYSNKSNCPCHPFEDNEKISPIAPIVQKTTARQTKSSIKLSSIPSLTENERNEVLKNWLIKKVEARKKQQLEEQKLKEEQEKQRQALIEKERESFKKWLEQKKRNEKLKQIEFEMKRHEQILNESQKQKREYENKFSYDLWLQKKKQEELEKKISEKVAYLQECKEKQRRLEENERAFNEWLKNSKNKPKPIPLNQGLLSTYGIIL